MADTSASPDPAAATGNTVAMKLNLRQIEIFRAIMITGSISGAARMLNVSQPGVSRLLAHIEDRLGLRLFNRVKGRLHATTEAQRLFEEVEILHEHVHRVNALAAALHRGKSGGLRIVVSPGLGQYVIPAAIAAFRKLHPQVPVELEVLTLSQIITNVSASRADIGVTVLPVNEAAVSSSIIAEGRMMIICHRDHPLAQLDEISVQDLLPHQIITYIRDSPYDLSLHRLRLRNASSSIGNTVVGFTPNACALVQAGLGAAVVDEFVTLGNIWPDVVARPLAPEMPMQVHLIMPNAASASRTAKAFVKCLTNVLRNFAPKAARPAAT